MITRIRVLGIKIPLTRQKGTQPLGIG
uniref:PsaB n=1 Tax=Arundo donax TaxID=35708 RepID=A0A0A9BVH4_ARUDO